MQSHALSAWAHIKGNVHPALKEGYCYARAYYVSSP